MIFHWIILWRAKAINYHFKEVSPHHTSYVNGVSVVGSPFPLRSTMPKHSCQYHLATIAACILHLHVRETKGSPFSAPTPAVLLRGCDMVMGNSQNMPEECWQTHPWSCTQLNNFSVLQRGQNVMTLTKERLKRQEQKPVWGVCLFIKAFYWKFGGLTDILEANLRWQSNTIQ